MEFASDRRKYVIGQAYITTSYNPEEESGMWDYVKRILPWSVIIREDSHSHPNNSTYPSGILDRSRDIAYANLLYNRHNVPV